MAMKDSNSREWIRISDNLRLPSRLLPALKRWVVLGTVSEDESSRLSRHGGGRI
jgi:hypothetical protein